MGKIGRIDRTHEGFCGRRIDELPSGWWRPLSLAELLSLGPVKIGPGDYSMRVTVLGRLYWERERLIFATESAKWLMQCLDDLGIFDEQSPQGLEPPEVLKALAVLRVALSHAEEIENPEEGRVGTMAESADKEL